MRRDSSRVTSGWSPADRPMTFLARIAWFLVGLVVFSFAVLAVNQDQSALRFLVWQTPAISLFWWLLLAFVAGLLVGGATVGLISLKHRLRARTLARQLALSEQEVTRLKYPSTP